MLPIFGFLTVLFFYLLMICLGFWSAHKFRLISFNITIDDVLLANRSIGLCVGCFTMAATWFGGSFVAGTAEVLNGSNGLIWCQAPIGYALSLVVGGRFFAVKMRNSGYRTVLDPFLWKYGDVMHCLLYIPALVGDITWTAGILNALGSSLKVVLNLKADLAIILSAASACCYTLIGGMYAVAYTDVLQILCMFFGMWLCIPFVLSDSKIEPLHEKTDWLGELKFEEVFIYLDTYFLLIFGAIPWQVYWQRVLATKSASVAKTLSYVGACSCIFMAIPAVLLGAAASNAHWNETSYGLPVLTEEDRPNTLSLVMLHFCPDVITYIGLGAIAAGVMSSTDSCLLSSSGLFARNIVGLIYFRVHKQKLSQAYQISIMRVALLVITCLSCVVALHVESTYTLWVLSGDIVYVVLFPQLLCVMFVRRSNAYGSLVSFVTGLTLRALGGEKMLNVRPVIYYPWYDELSQTQRFPFKTVSMLFSLGILIGVSYLTEFLFVGHYLPQSLDFYGCFRSSTYDHDVKPFSIALNDEATADVDQPVEGPVQSPSTQQLASPKSELSYRTKSVAESNTLLTKGSTIY